MGSFFVFFCFFKVRVGFEERFGRCCGGWVGFALGFAFRVYGLRVERFEQTDEGSRGG